jgi:hypothetical protein
MSAIKEELHILAFRRDVLNLMNQALEDPEIRRKIDLAPTWSDAYAILFEYAKAHGVKEETIPLKK